jgi:hypothetical protein
MKNTTKKQNPSRILELIVLLYGILAPPLFSSLLYGNTIKYFIGAFLFSSWFVAGLYIGSKGVNKK